MSKEAIQEAANKKILYTHHATVQMNSEDRLISTNEVREVIGDGEIIESRPNDPRGPVYLMMGKTSAQRVIHVVCSPKKEYLAVVTAYVPDPKEWSESLSQRQKS